MTPLEIAKAECANYRDGACQGIVIRDDGSMFRNVSMPPFCVLGKKGVRCRYFEECVLPMGTEGWKAHRKQEFEEGVKAYWDAIHPQGATKAVAKDRSCPSCGRPLEPLKRFCYICAETRRKEQTRRAVAKSRVRRKQSAIENENSTSDIQALTKPENGILEESISK